MSQLELKIPPPLVAATVAAGMVSVALWVGPVLNLPVAFRLAGALALAVLGACLDVAGIWVFRQAKTTVNPMAPERSAKLVVRGVYRITRNPMYLGLVLILLGLALYLAAPWALLGPLAFAAYITRFQIVPEERAMAARFGADYAAYCAAVRRWL
ncbi:MAG: isoprenylcysteine carboxylmethyltransferase family protein [Simplicispira suum]|uniref:methyltransferase family protein n=1 Tax=Simplicispira suum TaxID=2109915 RepID=UPI001C6B5D31|nr:isoprenylcysteine carboxylmethyltransferase family protein [Simplicispira suum]MBW7833142.1 isoprenylcysteine carboxylmethyltransferase family protein [Simplicispira suum]